MYAEVNGRNKHRTCFLFFLLAELIVKTSSLHQINGRWSSYFTDTKRVSAHVLLVPSF